MSALLLPEYGPPNLEFGRPAEAGRLERVARALEARGIHAVIAGSAEDAKKVVLDLVPEGAEVHIALSETMAELGVSAEIDESGRYDSVRSKLKKLDRETQLREIRKLVAAPDYVLGSVHQKIVRDLSDGLRRIREYSLPLEDARMKSVGRAGSALMKTLIIDGDRGRITVVLIPETIGF
jgi:hypothetical protein